MFAIATWRAPTLNEFISPSATSPAEPTFTHSAMPWSSSGRGNRRSLPRGLRTPVRTGRAGRRGARGPSPRQDVRRQVPDPGDQIQPGEDEERLAELEREHRRHDRARDPRELEDDLVPDEHAPVRATGRERLHQALEREASELGCGAD